MALALALTACGGIWTWYAWRNRGLGPGVRGIALTLLAPAAWLTGTLEVFGEIAHSISDWAIGFVFSPLVWIGIALFALSVVLFGVSAKLPGARDKDKGRPQADRGVAGATDDRSLGRSSGRGEPAIDSDLADIEEILRNRGIS